MTFTAVANSTIFDVCLNTYGTLDRLVKLMQDNDFGGISAYPEAGQAFTFDSSLVNLTSTQNLAGAVTVQAGASQTKFATKPTE